MAPRGSRTAENGGHRSGLYKHHQCVLGFGHDEPIADRAGVAVHGFAACMQQERLGRVVPSAESGAFRTDGAEQVRDTEGAERVEAEGPDRLPGTGHQGDPL